MSASREKKQRQSSAAGGLTEKQRREQAEAQKARSRAVLYGVIGVIVAVLVILLLVWNTGIFDRNKVAATINGKDYSITEVGYYYYPIANMYEQYAQFGLTSDEATMRQDALDSLHQTVALCEAAAAEGYTLSEEGQASVDEQMDQLGTYAAQSGVSKSYYMRSMYGPYMTESILRECLTRDALASEYYNNYSDSLEYTADDLQGYYAEHADELDSFTYSAAFINGAAAETDTSSGTDDTSAPEESAAPAESAAPEETSAPAEETAPAVTMESAQATANQLLADVQAGGDFDALAEAAIEGDDSSSYTDSNTLLGSSLASSLNADCQAWLVDTARVSGDMTVIEVADQGYWVLRFEDRFLDEASYGTADVRYISVEAEVAEDATEPTDEALEAARTEAQGLLDEYTAGEQNADAFASLATEHSDDLGTKDAGGLYEGVTPTSSSFSSAFTEWVFAEGRQPGDTGIVENDLEGQQGWYVIYLQAHTLTWENTARTALLSTDLNTWLSGIEADYPVTANEENMAQIS